MSKSVLRFDSVTKKYGSQVALHEISFTIEPGEIVAVLGANGAGKSTMINLATGLKGASSGQVTVFGLDPRNEDAKVRRRTLPQELSFPTHLRASEILSVVKAHYETSELGLLIERLELGPLLGRLAGEMSGGERRRLALACALVGNPELVLLDEPTANVDLIGQARIRELLIEYFRNTARSLVFSSHMMNEVEILATRLIVLRSGRIVADSPMNEMRKILGLKKVRLLPSRPLDGLKSAEFVQACRSHPEKTEVVGPDSDAILHEVLALDPKAKQIEILEPHLEETILKIWGQEGVR